MYKIVVYKETENGTIERHVDGTVDGYHKALALAFAIRSNDLVCVNLVDDLGKTVYQRVWPPYCVDFEAIYSNKTFVDEDDNRRVLQSPVLLHNFT